MLGHLFYQLNAFSTTGSPYKAPNTFGVGSDANAVEIVDNDGAFLLDNDDIQIVENT